MKSHSSSSLLSFCLGQCVCLAWGRVVESARSPYEGDQLAYALHRTQESLHLGVAAVSECVSVAVVKSTRFEDVFAGLEGCPAWTSSVLRWDESLVVVPGVCVSCATLDQSAESFPVRSPKRCWEMELSLEDSGIVSLLRRS